jgi:hypothetical protein
MLTIVLILLCFCFVAAGIVYYSIATHPVRAATWESLVAQIQKVNLPGLELVALSTLQPKPNQARLGSKDEWEIIGGLEGLEKMRDNSSILIALASYAQRWNMREAILVAEQMRRDAAQLKKALRHIRMGLVLHQHPSGQPFYVRDATAAYYLMTRRLLTLYQTYQKELLSPLAKAL